MKISGFTMCRNAEKLYYPISESIRSLLPLVDEFVIALGKSDEDDKTKELIALIDSPKIKIVHTVWDLSQFPNGTVHAQQTDLSKSLCTGDWLIYLQVDEVLHEEDLSKIKSACARELRNSKVEGFILDYKHFWGDYSHLMQGHSWYDSEIRIIRNDSEIHSWQSAQSFRKIPHFDGVDYRVKAGTRKLRVKKIDATVYHYGWVRPPELMTKKMQALDQIHSHESERFTDVFDYGDLSRLKQFSGSHPRVMKDWIEKMNWDGELNFGNKTMTRTYKFKHERIRYRLLSKLEDTLFNGKRIGAFENFKLLQK